MKKIYFVSNSEDKFNEYSELAKKSNIEIVWWKPQNLLEQQTEDLNKLIKNKALEAYKEIRRPLLVEHTVLSVKALSGLPGIQTKYFYDRIGCAGIVDYCKYKREFHATAKTAICFCDGKTFIGSVGEVKGRIARKESQIKDSFDWDTIFIPQKDNPKNKTFAEFSMEEKNERSMRKIAWERLIKRKDFQNSRTRVKEDREDEIRKLANLIYQKKVLLFVGAGISASVGMPTWNALLEKLGYRQDTIRVFSIHGDNMMLAEYAGNRRSMDVYDILREEMDINQHPEYKEKLKDSSIYSALMYMGFPVIYTTNYDHLLEEYFDIHGHKYDSVCDINDMENLHENHIRIMKFHGDIDKKDSIVLSESQYFKRMDFQSFMDVLLQADMLKYHVLFLGYSLSDINIKLMLYLARKRWDNGGMEKQDYIFTVTPNEIQKDVFRKNNIITFSGNEADKGKGTEQFLEKLLQYVRECGINA